MTWFRPTWRDVLSIIIEILTLVLVTLGAVLLVYGIARCAR